MSKFLSNAAIQEFDSEVKHEYQSMGKLRNTVALRTNVTGDAYKFTRMGQGLANQKATQADVTPMDISHGRQTATLENWNAPEYTDIFDQAEVNFDEKQELAKTIAKALARREDQIIIDAMAAGTYSATPGTDADTGFDIAAGAAALTVAKLRSAAMSGLTNRNVDDEDRTLICTAAGVEQLLGDPEVTSSDFNVLKALVSGTLQDTTYMGFNICIIGQRVEGGLPGTASDRKAFAYHKQALGYAVGIDMKTTIDWVAQKTSWLANGMLKAGAVVRENAGIVRIGYDETVVV
jgi:hypothetical protein